MSWEFFLEGNVKTKGKRDGGGEERVEGWGGQGKGGDGEGNGRVVTETFLTPCTDSLRCCRNSIRIAHVFGMFSIGTACFVAVHEIVAYFRTGLFT